jgi:hypothetical protein
MLERDATKRLTGRIEIDDAYLGDERHGGKRGCGAPGKTPLSRAPLDASDTLRSQPFDPQINR